MTKRIVPLLGWYVGIVLCCWLLGTAVALIEVFIEGLTRWQINLDLLESVLLYPVYLVLEPVALVF